MPCLISIPVPEAMQRVKMFCTGRFDELLDFLVDNDVETIKAVINLLQTSTQHKMTAEVVEKFTVLKLELNPGQLTTTLNDLSDSLTTETHAAIDLRRQAEIDRTRISELEAQVVAERAVHRATMRRERQLRADVLRALDGDGGRPSKKSRN